MFFCGVLFTALGLGLGAVFVLVFGALGDWVWPGHDLTLDRQHEVATATLLDKEWMRHTRVNGRHPWKVRFRFVDGSERTVEGVGFTFAQWMARTEEGDALEIEYDPANPTVARPAGGSVALVPVWVYGLVGGMLGVELLVGVTFLLLVWWRGRSEGILLAHGAAAEAEVTGVRRLGHIRFGRRNPFDVYYHFTDHYGRRVDGRDRTYHYDWAEGLKEGDRVGVVYNPRAPAANVLWLHGDETDSR
jgi:hypothetical protein